MNTNQNPQNGSTNFLNFSDALHHLRWGEKIARRAWSGSYVEVEYYEKETTLYIEDMYGRSYRISGEDIMAEDWYVV